MMDWMAPESLRKEREKKKKKKKIQAEVVKQEEAGARVDGTSDWSSLSLDDWPNLWHIEMDVDAAVAAGEVDLANAVDLSESEEEEELEDLIDDFALQTDLTEVCLVLPHFAMPIEGLPHYRKPIFVKNAFTSSSSPNHSQRSSHHPARQPHHQPRCARTKRARKRCRLLRIPNRQPRRPLWAQRLPIARPPRQRRPSSAGWTGSSAILRSTKAAR